MNRTKVCTTRREGGSFDSSTEVQNRVGGQTGGLDAAWRVDTPP